MNRLRGAVLHLALAWHLAEGHSFLAEPHSRNLVAHWAGEEFCYHCLQAGGPNTVKQRGAGVWPTKDAPESHGLCGDPVQNTAVPANWRDEKYLKPTPVQRTYRAGEVAEFHIAVSTHHRGHYEFRICDHGLDGATLASRSEGQACLNKWLLKREPPRANCTPNDADADCQPIDDNHPERWYLPPPQHGTQQAGAGWRDDYAKPLPSVTEVHYMRYRIPADLHCEHCTLQWYWSTGNTCLYDEGYFSYFKKMKALGWKSTDWCNFCTDSASCGSSCCGVSGKFAEEFWNCADVRVLPGGPTPAPVPTPAPPPTPAPLATPAPVTTPAPGPCSKLWGQCGGQSWSGARCCEAGTYCEELNPWYSQCLKGQGSPTPAPATTTPAPATTMPAPATPTPSPATPTPTPPSSPSPAPAGSCSCSKSTSWDGSFGQFAGAKSFCAQNFGGNNPFISGGGGDGASGGWSGEEPCQSGQYSFSEADGWGISVSAAQGQGKSPYRAFAYVQFCNGRAVSDCWKAAETVRFSFSFKTEGLAALAAYVKLLFWTDGGNIIGLLPPGHPKSDGSLKLLAFPSDDYPQSWLAEAQVEDDRWYHLTVEFKPATQGVVVFLSGTKLAEGTVPVDMLSSTSGPQIGVYSFDYSGKSWPDAGFKLWLDDACIGAAQGSCPSGSEGGVPTTAAPVTTQPTTVPPQTTPAPPQTTAAPPQTTAAPAPPQPEPEPEPEPTPGCTELCDRMNLTAKGSKCNLYGTDNDACSRSFIVKLGMVVPCRPTSCGCIADAAGMMSCPDLAVTCQSSTPAATLSFLQSSRDRPRGHGLRLRHSASVSNGLSLLQAESICYKSEAPLSEEGVDG